MKDLLAQVIAELKALSPAELAAEFAKHRDSDIAQALREIDEVASLSCSKLDKYFEIMRLRSFAHVRDEDFHTYALDCDPANDERFALAA
ncbi:hypothetical protein [Delftia sp. CH05]|uniref:hypothetical protein n=1 Tax=Delftia sp. CH05 TaxID=2692194 RepID=UPI00135E0551|nr:hypothetical protein [Delftia sp. CH05]MXN31492.1 hypothetical protein [Delftia sp. CH05]